jgi:hypothetical protein
MSIKHHRDYIGPPDDLADKAVKRWDRRHPKPATLEGYITRNVHTSK